MDAGAFIEFGFKLLGCFGLVVIAVVAVAAFWAGKIM